MHTRTDAAHEHPLLFPRRAPWQMCWSRDLIPVLLKAVHILPLNPVATNNSGCTFQNHGFQGVTHVCNEASPGTAHQPRKQLETDIVLGCVYQLISVYPKCSLAPSQNGFCAEELFIAFIK